MALYLRNAMYWLSALLMTPAITACSGGDGATSSANGSGSGACPAHTICLDVNVIQGMPGAGRVSVMWSQLNDDGPDPEPLVAYDAPFDPESKRVDIPLASITPPNEVNLVCQRACVDEVLCPCTGDVRLGFGYIFVSGDVDGNGKTNPTDIFTSMGGPAGVGYIILGYTETAYQMVPAPYDPYFPEGMDAGIRPYHVTVGEAGIEQLTKAKDGDLFDLNICPDWNKTVCPLPFPNLN